jgi:glutamate dehydrogenase
LIGAAEQDTHHFLFPPALEFEALWQEAEKTRKPKSILTDELSFAIVRLNEELRSTSLWNNVPLRNTVLEAALPKLLLGKLGLETLLKRVPEAYMQAIFGAYLASRFGESCKLLASKGLGLNYALSFPVDRAGVSPSQFAFFEYMQQIGLHKQ